LRKQTLRASIRKAVDRAFEPHEERCGARLELVLKAAVERALVDMIQAEGRAVRGWTRKEFLAGIEPGMRAGGAAQDAEDRLQRRIEKLNRSLTAAEKVILSLQRTRQMDPGVASIYRSIQGLEVMDEAFDTKLEMLTHIFESNVALRQALQSKARGAQTTGA